MNNITRDEIAEYIHQEFGLTKIDCNVFVNDIIEEIIKGLNNTREGEWVIQINKKILQNFDTEEDAKKYISKNNFSTKYKVILKRFVKIHNFGTFKIKNKKKRIGRNPKTKEEVMIKPRNVISFTMSKNSLSIINKDQ